MRNGKIPGHLAPIALMRAMGWDWLNYQAFINGASAQFVKDVYTMLEKEALLAKEKR